MQNSVQERQSWLKLISILLFCVKAIAGDKLHIDFYFTIHTVCGILDGS
jgi:hypothetical protein